MKPYRLMKVAEGQYNIRETDGDRVIGHLVNSGDNWKANIKAYADSFKTKEKALGFIRGVCTATVGSVFGSYTPLPGSATIVDLAEDAPQNAHEMIVRFREALAAFTDDLNSI